MKWYWEWNEMSSPVKWNVWGKEKAADKDDSVDSRGQTAV